MNNSGSMSGVAIGGIGNSLAVGTVGSVQHQDLVKQLRSVLQELEQGPHNDQESRDIEKVREAALQAEQGQVSAAFQSLAGVGRWVSEVARRVSATLVTREIEGLIS